MSDIRYTNEPGKHNFQPRPFPHNSSKAPHTEMQHQAAMYEVLTHLYFMCVLSWCEPIKKHARVKFEGWIVWVGFSQTLRCLWDYR